MSWQTPKTSWTVNDYYNLADLQRVVDNLIYLKQQLANIGYYSNDLETIDVTRGELTLPTVQLINKIEANLDTIAQAVGDWVEDTWDGRVVWVARTSTQWVRNPNYTDWNRWEQLTVLVISTIQLILSQKNRLSAGGFYAGGNRTTQIFSRGR